MAMTFQPIGSFAFSQESQQQQSRYAEVAFENRLQNTFLLK